MKQTTVSPERIADMSSGRRQRPFSKSRLVKELSWSCGLTQVEVRKVLETLREIARREARTTFVLPGLCKLEVVRRKPRTVRNPRTGETILLPEREGLRTTAPRSLKALFAKPVRADDPAAADEPPPAPKAACHAGPEAAVSGVQHTGPHTPVSFRCPRCGQEIEAAGEMAGIESECPACGSPLTVPAASEPGTLHADGPAGAETGETPAVISSLEAESVSPDRLKGLTIRIDVDSLGIGDGANPPAADDGGRMVSFACRSCKQHIEAPFDMAGESAQCPGCGTWLTVPAQAESGTVHAAGDTDPQTVQAMKGRTMRIDINEDF